MDPQEKTGKSPCDASKETTAERDDPDAVRPVPVYLAGRLCPHHSHHLRRAADDRHPRGQAARRGKSELILRAFLIPKPPDFTPLLEKACAGRPFLFLPHFHLYISARCKMKLRI